MVGVAGTVFALSVVAVATDTQLVPVFFVIIEYVFGTNPLKVAAA